MTPLARRVRAARYHANFVRWLVLAPMTAWPRHPERDDLHRWVQTCARRTFEILGIEFTVEGLEHVAGLSQAIYCSNHRSWLDQPAMIAAAPHLLHFIGAAKYFDMPVLGRVLKTYGCVPWHRGRSGQLVDRLAEVVEGGGSLAVYPEATRARDNRWLPFRSGGYVLSARTGVPIVPLYIYGAFDALPPQRPFSEVQPRPMRVVFDTPFVVPPGFLDDPDVEPWRDRFLAGWTAHA
ncbi:MAG: 1-acyl-sn-glycerol-3-phosphate acyltransferase [Bradymonadia bacterium]